MSADTPPQREFSGDESGAVPEIEVSISGVGFGPFTLEKLRERVEEGLLTVGDSARWTHSDEWVTVGDFLGAEVSAAEPPELFIHPPAADQEPEAGPEHAEEPEQAEVAETSGPAKILAPEPQPMPMPQVQSRPLTGPLIRARSSSTAPFPPGKGVTRPLGGLKSQILARTSQEPLKPMQPLPPARPPLAVTTPFKFVPMSGVMKPAPSTATKALAPQPSSDSQPERPASPAKMEPPGPEPTFEIPPTDPPSIAALAEMGALPPKPTFKFSPLAPTPPSAPVEAEIRPPEPTFPDPPVEPMGTASEPPFKAGNTISFASLTPPVEKKSETAMIRRHALPASKTGALSVLPVFTITASAEQPAEGGDELPPPAAKPPVKPPTFILPPRPGAAAARPPAGDAVISVRLPEKRNPSVETSPPNVPEEMETLSNAQRSASTHVSLPGVSASTTAPLTPAGRVVPVKKASSGSGVTLASVAAPPPDAVKGEQPKLRRGMGEASALAATTVMPGVASEPVVSPDPLPKTGFSFAKAVRSAFGPPQLVSDGGRENPPSVTVGNLADTRRSALKQARLRRRRQSIILGAVGLVCFGLFCLGIYHYTSYTNETPAPVPVEKKAAVIQEKATPPGPAAATPDKPSSTTTAKAPAPPTPAPPSNPQVLPLIGVGQAAQAKGDYDQAIAAFDQAVGLDPKYAQTYSYRAAAKMAKGDTAGAMADDNQLLALDPTNAAGFCQRGFIKQAAKDMDGALADYSRAVQLDPKSYVAFYNRGLIQEKAGKPDEAIADYNQTLTLNPKLAGAFYNRGNAKMDKNDLDGAVADYTSALALDPKIALAYCNRALAEQNSGNLNAALADYNKGLALDGKVAMAFYNRGLIDEQLDDLEGCVNDSTTAIQMNPDNAQAYYNRGVALQAKGNLEAAAIDLQKFTELAPKNAYADYARLYLWVIASQQGKKTEANQQLSSILTSTWNAEPAQLPSKIAAFLLDEISESDLMAAVSSDPKKIPGERCEALYFDGMKQLLNGKKSAATICLNQCLDTGQRDYCEFILAQAQLQAMNP